MRPTELQPDERAREWLASHPAPSWTIDYDVHRCCGGGKLCQVSVREVARGRPRAGYLGSELPDGTLFYIDPRAVRRLPPRVGLTVRGIGPLKHLDLELTGEQWGELLYS